MQARALNRQIRDFADSNVVGRDVINRKASGGALGRQQNGIDDVPDMDIGLALRSVTEDAQLMWGFHELPQKIKADPVSLSRSDNVTEPEHSSREIKHVAVGTNQRLTGKLTGPVCRDGNERTIVFVDFRFAQ